MGEEHEVFLFFSLTPPAKADVRINQDSHLFVYIDSCNNENGKYNSMNTD